MKDHRLRKKGRFSCGIIMAILFCITFVLCGCDSVETVSKGVKASSGGGVSAEYMTADIGGSSGTIIVKFTNNNAYDVDLCVDLSFFSSDGSAQEAENQENPCLAAGECWYTFFESQSTYSDYGCSFRVERAAGVYSEENSKMSLEAYTGENGEADYSVTNNWDSRAEIEMTVFFFNALDASVTGCERTDITAEGNGKVTTGTIPGSDQYEYDIYAVYWHVK